MGKNSRWRPAMKQAACRSPKSFDHLDAGWVKPRTGSARRPAFAKPCGRAPPSNGLVSRAHGRHGRRYAMPARRGGRPARGNTVDHNHLLGPAPRRSEALGNRGFAYLSNPAMTLERKERGEKRAPKTSSPGAPLPSPGLDHGFINAQSVQKAPGCISAPCWCNSEQGEIFH